MLRTTNGHYPIGEAIWIAAGFIILLAFGDVVIILALAVAAAALIATWWAHRKAEHDVASSDAELAPVTQLRPAVTRRHDVRGPRAA